VLFRSMASVSSKFQQLLNAGKVINIVGNSKEFLIILSNISKKQNLQNVYYVPSLQKAIKLQESNP